MQRRRGQPATVPTNDALSCTHDVDLSTQRHFSQFDFPRRWAPRFRCDPTSIPSWHTISEWALGPYGWLMRAAFFANALAYASLFVVLRQQLRKRMGRRRR